MPLPLEDAGRPDDRVLRQLVAALIFEKLVAPLRDPGEPERLVWHLGEHSYRCRAGIGPFGRSRIQPFTVECRRADGWAAAGLADLVAALPGSLENREKQFVKTAFGRYLAPALVERLKTTRVNIAGQDHVAYQWISIHSGHGGGAEADHFEWATQGAKLAFRFVPEAQHAALKQDLQRGFQSFAADHLEFFQRVNESTAS